MFGSARTSRGIEAAATDEMAFQKSPGSSCLLSFPSLSVWGSSSQVGPEASTQLPRPSSGRDGFTEPALVGTMHADGGGFTDGGERLVHGRKGNRKHTASWPTGSRDGTGCSEGNH